MWFAIQQRIIPADNPCLLAALDPLTPDYGAARRGQKRQNRAAQQARGLGTPVFIYHWLLPFLLQCEGITALLPDPGPLFSLFEKKYKRGVYAPPPVWL